MQSESESRPKRKKGDWKLLLQLLKLARPEWKILGVGTIFLITGVITNLVYPQAFRTIIDNALNAKNPDQVNRIALIVLAVTVGQAIAATARYYFFTIAGERTVLRLREQLYEHILNQEIAYFDFNKTGDLMSRLSNDCSLLQSAVSVNISMGTRFFAQAVGGLILLFYTSPKLALVVMLTVPPVGLLAGWYGRKIRGTSEKTQDYLGEASQVAEETISGVRTVRAFSQEAFEKNRYAQSLALSWGQAVKRIRQGAWFSGLTSLFGYVSIAGVLWYGGRLIISGEMTIGALMQFLLYLFAVAFSVGALGSLWTDYNNALGAATRIFAVFDRKPVIYNDVGRTLTHVAGSLEFKNVYFSYPSRPDLEVLSGVSFELKPGKSVALVGASGSGKTTVASLLIRLYDPTRGEIRLDGNDIRELEPNWLRTNIGVVSQEPILISASIEENIRYGRPEASREDIIRAAEIANAHGFIMGFPQGYQTLVGERGIQLYGGQKQRVAIARAVLKDPRVLILDEATSALDTESESLVQEALNRLMQGRTTLVIAHRLATIRNSSLILVMEKGSILEAGTHAELAQKQDGHYQRLINKQVFALS